MIRRLPWQSPVHHDGGEDAGIDALQTDVMRFMAILGFCLLAIFALVQSVPWSSPRSETMVQEPAVVPEPAPEPLMEQPKKPQPVVREAAPERPVPAPVTRPPVTRPVEVVKETPPPPGAEPSGGPFPREVVALTEPRPSIPETVPEPRQKQTAPAVPPPVRQVPIKMAPVEKEAIDETVAQASLQPGPAEETTPAPEPQASPQRSESPRGFTLRFDSDEALRKLVELRKVGLYAVSDGRSWRMTARGQSLSFINAAKPEEFHEMAASTVPEDVQRALRRRAPVSMGQVTWGVVLPDALTRELNDILRRETGGDLIIDGSGGLRLERG